MSDSESWSPDGLNRWEAQQEMSDELRDRFAIEALKGPVTGIASQYDARERHQLGGAKWNGETRPTPSRTP